VTWSAPVWLEAFAALKIDLSSEPGRAKLPGLKKLPLFGILPMRVAAEPLCARIDTLAPLAYCAALTEIDLCTAPFSDLGPLRELTLGGGLVRRARAPGPRTPHVDVKLASGEPARRARPRRTERCHRSFGTQTLSGSPSTNSVASEHVAAASPPRQKVQSLSAPQVRRHTLSPPGRATQRESVGHSSLDPQPFCEQYPPKIDDASEPSAAAISIDAARGA